MATARNVVYDAELGGHNLKLSEFAERVVRLGFMRKVFGGCCRDQKCPDSVDSGPALLMSTGQWTQEHFSTEGLT